MRLGNGAFGILDEGTWSGFHGTIKHWPVSFLVVALAGVGLGTELRILEGLGVKPFLVGLGAAVLVGVVSFASISLLSAFVAW